MSKAEAAEAEESLMVFVLTEMHTRHRDDDHTYCKVHGVFRELKLAQEKCDKLFKQKVLDYLENGPLEIEEWGGGRHFSVREVEGTEYDISTFEISEANVQ